MSSQNIFDMSNPKPAVNKSSYRNFQRIFRQEHPELSVKQQLSQGLLAWRLLSPLEKSSYQTAVFGVKAKETVVEQLPELITSGQQPHVSLENATTGEGATDAGDIIEEGGGRAATADGFDAEDMEGAWGEYLAGRDDCGKQQQEQQRHYNNNHCTDCGSGNREDNSSNRFECPLNVRIRLAHLDFVTRVTQWCLFFDGFHNPIEFVERLEELCGIYCQDVNRLPAIMPLLLTKKALVWYRNNVQRRRWYDWHTFRKDFFEFFLPQRFAEQQKSAIENRLQRQGESFQNFILSLQNLMRHTQMSETEQLERIYGNSLPILRLYIKRKDFSTLEELVTLAIDFEFILKQQLIQKDAKQQAYAAYVENCVAAKYCTAWKTTNAPDHQICRQCGELAHCTQDCPNQRQCYSWEYGNDYWLAAIPAETVTKTPSQHGVAQQCAASNSTVAVSSDDDDDDEVDADDGVNSNSNDCDDARDDENVATVREVTEKHAKVSADGAQCCCRSEHKHRLKVLHAAYKHRPSYGAKLERLVKELRRQNNALGILNGQTYCAERDERTPMVNGKISLSDFRFSTSSVPKRTIPFPISK